ncbi:hypothetical protein ILYODFUR_025892 [Ilyodon furcidens]|uniref:Uncharacterized protein n=1 Tax=Ilyodon furcidens TaxID=33524 RepID=A0ABV0V887_9TELE
MWCYPGHAAVKCSFYSLDIELLGLSYRPREFTGVILATVYIPLSAQLLTIISTTYNKKNIEKKVTGSRRSFAGLF